MDTTNYIDNAAKEARQRVIMVMFDNIRGPARNGGKKITGIPVSARRALWDALYSAVEKVCE